MEQLLQEVKKESEVTIKDIMQELNSVPVFVPIQDLD